MKTGQLGKRKNNKNIEFSEICSHDREKDILKHQ